MTIIDKIKKSVETATDYKFYYDSPETLNTRLDNIELPCVMMNLIESGTATDENGIIRERMTIQVLFVDLCEIDLDGVDTEVTLDKLKRRAFAWLCQLRKSEDLNLIENVSTARYYQTNDANICAFAVSVIVEEIEGVSKCTILE